MKQKDYSFITEKATDRKAWVQKCSYLCDCYSLCHLNTIITVITSSAFITIFSAMFKSDSSNWSYKFSSFLKDCQDESAHLFVFLASFSERRLCRSYWPCLFVFQNVPPKNYTFYYNQSCSVPSSILRHKVLCHFHRYTIFFWVIPSFLEVILIAKGRAYQPPKLSGEFLFPRNSLLALLPNSPKFKLRWVGAQSPVFVPELAARW